MAALNYGDRVRATYRPTEDDSTTKTREGVVVAENYGDDMTEVYFGTLSEYEMLLADDDFQIAHDATGVFYPDEIEKIES